MRGLNCRGLRLNKFVILGMALALPAWAMGAGASTTATQTRMTAETHDLHGRTQAALSVSVAGADGVPATGAVVIEDAGKPVAGAVLGDSGTAQISVGLLPGAHALRAVYVGDASHQTSVSEQATVNAQTSATPGFQIAVSPGSMTLTAGQTGNVAVSVTPVNASALSAPMFVTLSCSGNPDQSACTFTPQNIEILPNATAAVTSNMVLSTQAKGTRSFLNPIDSGKSTPMAWALLLPGVLGLGGLAFGARRRRWLQRLSLIALLGLLSTFGMTACAPRYNYFNHGPAYNLPTPPGTYQMQVTAQSSNGVTAITENAGFALTVQ